MIFIGIFIVLILIIFAIYKISYKHRVGETTKDPKVLWNNFKEYDKRVRMASVDIINYNNTGQISSIMLQSIPILEGYIVSINNIEKYMKDYGTNYRMVMKLIRNIQNNDRSIKQIMIMFDESNKKHILDIFRTKSKFYYTPLSLRILLSQLKLESSLNVIGGDDSYDEWEDDEDYNKMKQMEKEAVEKIMAKKEARLEFLKPVKKLLTQTNTHIMAYLKQDSTLESIKCLEILNNYDYILLSGLDDFQLAEKLRDVIQNSSDDIQKKIKWIIIVKTKEDVTKKEMSKDINDINIQTLTSEWETIYQKTLSLLKIDIVLNKSSGIKKPQKLPSIIDWDKLTDNQKTDLSILSKNTDPKKAYKDYAQKMLKSMPEPQIFDKTTLNISFSAVANMFTKAKLDSAFNAPVTIISNIDMTNDDFIVKAVQDSLAVQDAQNTALNDTALAKEAQDAALAKEAQDAALAKEVQDAALAKEAQDAALAKEAQDAALAKEAQDTALAKEAQDAALAKEAQDTALAKEAQDTTLAKEAQDVLVPASKYSSPKTFPKDNKLKKIKDADDDDDDDLYNSNMWYKRLTNFQRINNDKIMEKIFDIMIFNANKKFGNSINTIKESGSKSIYNKMERLNNIFKKLGIKGNIYTKKTLIKKYIDLITKNKTNKLINMKELRKIGLD